MNKKKKRFCTIDNETQKTSLDLEQVSIIQLNKITNIATIFLKNESEITFDFLGQDEDIFDFWETYLNDN